MIEYMTVVLKEAYKIEETLHVVNQLLSDRYGVQEDFAFSTNKFVQQTLHVLNTDPNMVNWYKFLKRPVTAEELANRYTAFRIGEYWGRVTAPHNLISTCNSIAVCKWIEQTDARYIDTSLSKNYTRDILYPATIKFLRNNILNPSIIWEMPE